MAVKEKNKTKPGIHQGVKSLGLKRANFPGLLKAIQAGFSYSALVHFQKHSLLPLQIITKVLAIPARTLARRKAEGWLTGPESERLIRLANLYDGAVALFEGNRSGAASWLQTPCKALGNQSPLALAETEIGARMVEDLIGRLEHGVFS